MIETLLLLAERKIDFALQQWKVEIKMLLGCL